MELESTGERVVTSMGATFGVVEHLHRYGIAQEFCGGRVVLDIASGEGYGCALLATIADSVYGVDISAEAVKHAGGKYKAQNLSFLAGSVAAIPLQDNSVDVVTCFETIEHHDQHDAMFSEFRRVLRQDGVLLLSSPEKTIYHRRDQANKFHIKEINSDELRSLVSRHFRYASYFSQMLIVGSLIEPVGDQSSDIRFFSGDFSEIRPVLCEKGLFNQPFFNLVICTDDESKAHWDCGTSLFCGYDAYANEFGAYDHQLNETRRQFLSSRSYRLGHLLLMPFRVVRRLARYSIANLNVRKPEATK